MTARWTEEDLQRYQRLRQGQPEKPAPKQRPRMNKTEQCYAAHLARLKMADEIVDYEFEPCTFLLTERTGTGSKRTRYTPDFLVVHIDGTIQFVEIKGPYAREDSILKFKFAADRFPWFRWTLVQVAKTRIEVKRDYPAWEAKCQS